MSAHPAVRIARAVLLAVVVGAALAVGVAGLRQSTPNAAAVVNGVSPHCTEDHLTLFFDRSGPLPTRECRYPPIGP